jgi:hypothetical protein
MMLSPSAARMGFTSFKQINRRNVRRFSVTMTTSRRPPALGKSRLSYAPAGQVFSDVSRWKSTMASQDEVSDEDEETDPAQGHAETALARAKTIHSHGESWMINLGRDGDNEWLLGPRDPDDWFTGLKPTVCPGKIHSLFVVL